MIQNLQFPILFTDEQTKISQFLLLNGKRLNYITTHEALTKQLIFIDPSVMELKHSTTFSQNKLLHKLVKIIDGFKYIYISIDFPCDMNLKYEDLFIYKSFKNNLKYCNNFNYICTIQSKFMNYQSFYDESEKLRYIWEQSNKIIGIGNLCRIIFYYKLKSKPKHRHKWKKYYKKKHSNEFVDKITEYIKINFKNRWVHFYGLSFQLICKMIPILHNAGVKCSVDSTKFTKAITHEFKLSHGVCCRKHNRNLYFLEYINEIKKRCGIDFNY